MSITLADSYYLKALNLYPFELDQVIEALNYAISYNCEHAGANYLLGLVNMYQLGKYSEAENHFEKALAGDINYPETYYAYINLLIQIGDYDRALNLNDYAYNVKGINVARLRHNEGLIAEIKGDLHKAKEYMKLAYSGSYRKNERDYLKDELERVNSKIKSSKKQASNKREE